MATRENLGKAFAGESQANQKYLAYAKRAEAEGYHQIARLFRMAAAGETVHACIRLEAMGRVKSTEENLQAAIKGAEFEFRQMYPKFSQEARQEGKRAILGSFQNAMAVEQVHYSLCIEALAHLKAGNDVPERRLHACSGCGNPIVGELPEKCAVCRGPRSKFKAIE